MAPRGGYLRIFSPDQAEAMPAHRPDAHLLASQELLRPCEPSRRDRDLEPFSRAWFEEIELKRYVRHGYWLPRVLEFSRHGGESMLMIGPGLGTDALQYLRHGTRVTIALRPGDHPDILRRNFEYRAAQVEMTPAGPDGSLRFTRGLFDLAYLNLLHQPLSDLTTTVQELYRVLKPGGKLFGLFPAKYDAGYWQDYIFPLQHWYWKRPADSVTTTKYTYRTLRGHLEKFTELRTTKRHLRRSQLPHAWRVLPLSLLERLMGQILVIQAFKPLSAAREDLADAA